MEGGETKRRKTYSTEIGNVEKQHFLITKQRDSGTSQQYVQRQRENDLQRLVMILIIKYSGTCVLYRRFHCTIRRGKGKKIHSFHCFVVLNFTNPLIIAQANNPHH